MIYSDITFDKKCREKLMDGVQVMAEAVGSTLGPQGKNVAIAYASQYGEIWNRIVVHDGVTVAKAIELKDAQANMGAQLLKQAAQKQVDEVGDGTTVSIILARAILEGFQELVAGGVNPMKLRKSLEDAVDQIVSEIEKLALPVKGISQITHIAVISSEDEELGKLVAKTVDEMGVDGLIAVEESKNADTTVEKQDGLQLDKGYIHTLFVTDPETLVATLESPAILVTDTPVNTLVEMADLLKNLSERKRPFVLFTPQIGQEAMSLFIQNKVRGLLPCLVVQAPSFGQNQKNILEDIATLTGGRFISADAGYKLSQVKYEDLGKCNYVTATKRETIIVGGQGKKADIEARIAGIRKAIDGEEIDFDREKLKERLAKLTSGVAVIKVGGATEVEMRERLERAKDAVAATKAAMKKGIVPGGEVVFLKVRDILGGKTTDWEGDLARNLLYKALYEPFRKLLTNAGMNDGQWYERIRTQGKSVGVDVMRGADCDMVKSGIVDPALVPIRALINASSVAIQIATTGTSITQEYETNQPKK